MNKQLLLMTMVFVVAFFAISGSAQSKTVDPPNPKIEEPKKAESSLLAKWEVVISAPGTDYVGTLHLEKSGDKYKGSVTTELGESPLDNIKMDGDSFTSTIVVNAQGQTFDGTMSGKAKDGKIAGELNLSALGAIPYSGKKP